MVLKGQFLERPALISVGDLVLEGLWHRGERSPPLLVLPPRPDEGGGMDHVVCAELTWAAARAGHPVLRFNYRGVGGSQGKPGGPQQQVEDARGALQLLLENTGAAAVAAASVGGSARVLLELQPERLAGAAFVGPLDVDPLELKRLEVPGLGVLAEKDDRAPRAAWAAAIETEVIDNAGASFDRNLPQVGKAVVRWMASL